MTYANFVAALALAATAAGPYAANAADPERKAPRDPLQLPSERTGDAAGAGGVPHATSPAAAKSDNRGAPVAGNAGDTAADDASAASKAQPSANSGEASAMFRTFDVNKDGYITREEANNSATLSAQFDALDVNHDGKISAEEMHGFQVNGASARARIKRE